MIKSLKVLYTSAGGAKFTFGTPYIYIAIILTFIFTDRSMSFDWAQISISILPSLLGFSLANFAILLALFGPANISKLSVKNVDSGISPLMKLTAIVIHTAIVQLLAIIFSFGMKQEGICGMFWPMCGWESVVRSLCNSEELKLFVYVGGLFLTIYGLILVLSTLIAVFQTSKMTR